MDHSTSLILSLNDVTLKDLDTVGGKACSLGEMINSVEVEVPEGFVLTTASYDLFMNSNKFTDESTKKEVASGELPEKLKDMIRESYHGGRVAVRSSATGEDLPDASFAGQQDTYLNVYGEQAVLEAVVSCYSSLFNQRAISYRKRMGFPVGKLAVVVQEMADALRSGVAFSLDTESGFDQVVVVNASYGLGEMVVSGQVIPDEYQIFKPTGKLICKEMGFKERGLFDSGEQVISECDRKRFCLTDEEAEQVAQAVLKLEAHYKCYVDVEWAFDRDHHLKILQVRPETTHKKERLELVQYEVTPIEDPLVTGIAVGEGLGSGVACYLSEPTSEHIFEPGSVLITDITNPDWEPIMQQASAIVTRRGGRTCHAAIVAREMGLPCVVGCKDLVFEEVNEKLISVSCAEGSVGKIYSGFVPHKRIITKLDQLRSAVEDSPVDLMLNVGSPDLAYQYARYPCAGVGLAREEFIITNYIGIHPRALLENKASIPGYEDGRTGFVNRLAHGMAKIAAAFYPKPVIVRFSDFKTNEYRGLKFGEEYEPEEENPMIGWRGAARYYSDDYREAFGMECEAVRMVREKMGLTNLIVMIPFVRSVDELIKVQAVMSHYGLERGKAELQVYMMAELPANVFMANQFAQLVDGFSIGSNDLTQTILATDRDNGRLNHLFDEMNPAVLEAIRTLVKAGADAGIKVGICGQGPSDKLELAQFLSDINIGSISVTPDSLLKTASNLV